MDPSNVVILPLRRARLLLLPLALTAAVAIALPAEAAPPKTKLPQLDLVLRHDDIQLAPQSRRRGYAVRVKEDPWSALAGDSQSLAGPAIPQFPDEEEDAGGEADLPLLRLLEGKTIPLLRIRVGPPS